MTIVVELRDLKKGLPRPVTHFWQRSLDALCALRVRLVSLGLLLVALGYPVDGAAAPHDGVLASLCAVLTAAVSATAGLVCDASGDLLALFADPSSPAFELSQRISLCFAEPALRLDVCPAAGPFPTFSGQRAWALAACVALMFGCGFARRASAKQGARR
jgi:hypothetical protein